MKRIIVVITGLLFLAGTGLVLAEDATKTSKKLESQANPSQSKFTFKKLTTGLKLGKPANAKQRVQLNPQPEPPAPKKVKQRVQLNPQPEPPRPKSKSFWGKL
jgi:hypothetical protein